MENAIYLIGGPVGQVPYVPVCDEFCYYLAAKTTRWLPVDRRHGKCKQIVVLVFFIECKLQPFRAVFVRQRVVIRYNIQLFSQNLFPLRFFWKNAR